jgi:hypothetical protein
MDVAACAGNAQAPLYITEKEDALATPWHMGLNWCNPPFRMFGKFTARAHEQWESHGCQTILLAIASLSTNWWKNNAHGKCRVVPIQRPRFVGHEADFPKDMALLVYAMGGRGVYEERWDWKKEC